MIVIEYILWLFLSVSHTHTHTHTRTHLPNGQCLNAKIDALSMLPGMPHNQLGTLAGSRYYNVDAAYYYMRWLVNTVVNNGIQFV